jgi:excisionase family DNA binding protein
MAEEKVLTAGEAADYLGVHVKTVRKWADRGWLASVRWPNGWRYFRRSDLDEMRVRMGTEPAARQSG